ALPCLKPLVGTAAVVAGLLLPMGAVTAQGASTQNAATAAAGKDLFQTYCSTCHGPNAAGGIKLGDAVSADIRWQAIGPRYHDDPQLVTRAILDGLDEHGKPLDDAMPRWKETLSPQQAADVVAYLQTLTAPVSGQIVATPAGEEKTPQPTEEALEAQQKTSVLARAKETASSTGAAVQTNGSKASAATTGIAAPGIVVATV
ncbi:MAG: c-type cytochrome, partial [Chloroflexi bacterium]|nr:c-type cytochrome [Chloroflexota bacterium]